MLQHTKLKNGLTLITAPLRSTQAATVLVLLPVGSRYEAPGVNGVSHFIEHLLFKGTERRPTTLDISRVLDAIGAEYNAFTSKDHTAYYIKLAADKLELAFDMLSDMLLHSKFDRREMDKERGVIVEEINMYEDNPLMHIENIFEQLLFPNHPLGQFIAGPRRVIQKVSREALVEYKNNFYFPANMTVAVAGNVTHVQTLRLARKYFSVSTEKQKTPGYRRFTARTVSKRVAVLHKPTNQAQLALGFRGLPLNHPDMPALVLLGIIAGGNMSSRLFVSVREQHGLAYSIHASADCYQDIGTFSVQAGLDKSRIAEAIRLIVAELKTLRDTGVTAKELADAKQFSHGKTVLSLEDSENVAVWYARQHGLLKRIQTPEQRLKKIDAVKRSDIARVAKRIIRSEGLHLAVIGPFRDAKPFARLLKI